MIKVAPETAWVSSEHLRLYSTDPNFIELYEFTTCLFMQRLSKLVSPVDASRELMLAQQKVGREKHWMEHWPARDGSLVFPLRAYMK